MFKLAPEKEESAYTTTTEMTMDGVTTSNFESMKEDLTAIIAKSLGVPKTSVKLTIKETDSISERGGDAVITATISIKGEDDKGKLENSIASGSFTKSMNEEIKKSPTLSKAGIQLESASNPIVKISKQTCNVFIYLP
jgi:hypothetical protein